MVESSQELQHSLIRRFWQGQSRFVGLEGIFVPPAVDAATDGRRARAAIAPRIDEPSGLPNAPAHSRQNPLPRRAKWQRLKFVRRGATMARIESTLRER